MIRLDEAADILTGFPFKSANYVAFSERRLLRGDNLTPGSIRWEGAKYYDDTIDVDPAFEVREGDTVLAMDRPWIEAGLKLAYVRASDSGAYLVQRVARIRARSGFDPKYVSLVLRTRAFMLWIHAVTTGTAVPHISAAGIGAFAFKPHSLPEQQEISSVIGALDEKIFANEKASSAIHNYAALRFRAAIAGGSEAVKLSSLARFVNGGAYTKGASGTGRVVIRIAELNNGVGGGTVYSDIQVPSGQTADPGDILFAWSGSLTLHRWTRQQAIVNQHIFKVLPEVGRQPWLVYQAIGVSLDALKAIAADKATTMGHIKREHLDILVSIPSEGIVNEMDGEMSNLWALGLKLERENQNLIAVRESLLPALMSGRLFVRGATRAPMGVI
jgi:type I restriction enzyme S subunit